MQGNISIERTVPHGVTDGMVAYGWQAIRHWAAFHGESAGENIPAGIPGGAR